MIYQNEHMSAPIVGSNVIETTMLPGIMLLTGMKQPIVPIELKSLCHISVMQVLAMKWEAAPFTGQ